MNKDQITEQTTTLCLAIDSIVEHINLVTKELSQPEQDYVMTHVAIRLLRDIHIDQHDDLLHDKGQYLLSAIVPV